MGIYRKKPVEIEARQFDGTDECGRTLQSWMNGEQPDVAIYQPAGFALAANLGDINDIDPDAEVPTIEIPQIFSIRTLEGWHTVSRGDFVIRGVAGEFYPCKPDIFEQTYEQVS
jgi:hypothetical protein